MQTLSFFSVDPPQRSLEQKILTHPPHQTLVVGRASSVLKGEASGLKRERNEAVKDLRITWSLFHLRSFP